GVRAEPAAPRQLPAAVPGFAGRELCLKQLDALAFDSGTDVPAAVLVIIAVGGMAGVGKTALAVHWAHRVAERFPDGQLYVNLRGFDPAGAAVDPNAAVRDFLEALGMLAGRGADGVGAPTGQDPRRLAGTRGPSAAGHTS